MRENLSQLVNALKTRREHLLLVSGNIYDVAEYGSFKFDNMPEFIAALTKQAFPQCLSYDLFGGLKVLRGDERQILESIKGKEEPKKPSNPAEEYVLALKAAKQKEGGSAFPADPAELFPILNKLLTAMSTPTILMIEYADKLFPAMSKFSFDKDMRSLGVAISKWGRDRIIRKNGHAILLFAKSAEDLDEGILDRSNQINQIRIGKPNEDERKKFLLEENIEEYSALVLGKLSSGLALRDLKTISEFERNSKNLERSTDFVMSFKKKILEDEYGDVLEFIETRDGFEAIGGMEKQIEKLKQIAEAMRNGRTDLVPMGLRLDGPPGTGKTKLAQAFARMAGINCVRPTDIKNMFLGESERRMTKFLNGLRDLAPVCPIMDEFDQNQGQRGGFDGDSGTSRNLFKKMAEATSDESQRGEVLWIYLTNRPDLIDSAMKRPGRCDIAMPCLPPGNLREIEAVCKAALVQNKAIKSDVADWSGLAPYFKGYSGAAIIKVILKAWQHAVLKLGKNKLEKEDVEWACHDHIPSVNQEEHALMALLALKECDSQELLPDNWKEVVKNCVEVLGGGKYLEEARVQMPTFVSNPSKMVH